MAFKLAIANTIITKVKGAFTDENGQERAFEFQLEQSRIDQAALQASATNNAESTSEFIKRVTTGWRGQRLVQNDDGSDAAFSPEALDVLLSISGMAGYCYRAYLEQVLVHAKN
jgi:hypothetical protein